MARKILKLVFIALLLCAGSTSVFSQAPRKIPRLFGFDGKNIDPRFDDLTQINVRLPNNLPSGDLLMKIQLRGNESNLAKIRIQ